MSDTVSNPFNGFIGDTISSANISPEIKKSQDTTLVTKRKEKRHSPAKAAWMSAVFPGLGQAYNKKWWKIPIIYAGFGGLGYGLYHFGSNYSGFRRAYRLQVDNDSLTIGSYRGITNAAELKFFRDDYKRNLDLMGVLTAVWYALNIIDAAVDGHLFHWNVDDKLTLRLHPYAPNMANSILGLRLELCWNRINFSKKNFAYYKNLNYE
ncbi:MAG: DUF5683 domain-containing protein [Chitinophagales bacterium]|nr:DUF5683 domain-containing protein [Chitinophagales bacterium]